jgi:hypothetical protein
MLDHDEDMVAAFVEFGAPWPECLMQKRIWDDEPLRWLDHYGRSMLTVPQQQLLACDWAEHVLPISAKSHFLDDALFGAIQATRAYWEGKGTKTKVREALRRVEKTRRPGEHRTHPPSHTVSEAVKEAGRMAAQRTERWMTKDYIAERSIEAMLNVATNAGWAAEARGGFDLRDEEFAWQIAHALRVIDAINKGKPWPALS